MCYSPQDLKESHTTEVTDSTQTLCVYYCLLFRGRLYFLCQADLDVDYILFGRLDTGASKLNSK